MHAIRTDRYKYIHYFGIWDIDELYDIEADPHERNNLVSSPEHEQTVEQLKTRMFDELERTGGMYIPLYRDRGRPQNLRHAGGSPAADFPPELIRGE
jgi:N-acetylglucosamine-6-sulfatase